MIDVLYEDNHLIAINKRSGDIIQGDKTGDITLSEYVKRYLKEKYKKPGNVFLGTIHRLDRPTSGVVIFAKTSKCLTRMNKLFKEKKVKKTYLAIVSNKPPLNQGTLKNYLRKNEKQNKSYIVKEKEGKYSILQYKLLKKLNHYYLIKISPETGRHHQIRAQLSNIGCYIKGDVKYGDKRKNKNLSIHLLAYQIQLNHPVKKEDIIITAKPPKDILWKACNIQESL